MKITRLSKTTGEKKKKGSHFVLINFHLCAIWQNTGGGRGRKEVFNRFTSMYAYCVVTAHKHTGMLYQIYKKHYPG